MIDWELERQKETLAFTSKDAGSKECNAYGHGDEGFDEVVTLARARDLFVGGIATRQVLE